MLCYTILYYTLEDRSEERQRDDRGAHKGMVRRPETPAAGFGRVEDGRGKGLLVPHQISRIVLLVALPVAIEGLAGPDDLGGAAIGKADRHPKGTGDALAVHLRLDDGAILVHQLRDAVAEALLGSLDPLGLLYRIEGAKNVGIEGLPLSGVGHGRPGGAFVGISADAARVAGGNTGLLLEEAHGVEFSLDRDDAEVPFQGERWR